MRISQSTTSLSTSRCVGRVCDRVWLCSGGLGISMLLQRGRRKHASVSSCVGECFFFYRSPPEGRHTCALHFGHFVNIKYEYHVIHFGGRVVYIQANQVVRTTVFLYDRHQWRFLLGGGGGGELLALKNTGLVCGIFPTSFLLFMLCVRESQLVFVCFCSIVSSVVLSQTGVIMPQRDYGGWCVCMYVCICVSLFFCQVVSCTLDWTRWVRPSLTLLLLCLIFSGIDVLHKRAGISARSRVVNVIIIAYTSEYIFPRLWVYWKPCFKTNIIMYEVAPPDRSGAAVQSQGRPQQRIVALGRTRILWGEGVVFMCSM